LNWLFFFMGEKIGKNRAEFPVRGIKGGFRGIGAAFRGIDRKFTVKSGLTYKKSG
jgi:hypothetical protein